MVLARLETGYPSFYRKGSFLGMNKKLARRDTPDEGELSLKREELSNLQMVLAQGSWS